MGRENSDQAIIYSSIALLQERFRQLQRVKEMREEREMLKILPGSSEHYYDEPAKLFYHSDPVLPRKGVALASPPPSSSSARVFLSLWPDTEMKHAEDNFSNVKSPTWRSDTPLARSPSIKTDHDTVDCDVDTSLHL